jgi:hypothetical protein
MQRSCIFLFFWVSYARFGGRFPQNRQEVAQNSKDIFEGLRDNFHLYGQEVAQNFLARADMSIRGGLLFIWGVVPRFPFTVSIAVSQKNWFWHSKKWKHIFHGMKQKSGSVAFLAIPRVTRVSDMASFRQTIPWSGPNCKTLLFVTLFK